MDKMLYYCCGMDRESDGEIHSVLLVELDIQESKLCGYRVLPPMSLEQASGYNTENITITETEKGYQLCNSLCSDRIPSLKIDENGFVRLAIKAFEGRYHRLNPKRLWPSKTALLRTVTVLGETVRTCQKYVNYWMTNRKFQLLDENHTEYGYYVCDYNGAVSYLSFLQMQSIGNRYGFTNARVNGERVTKLDGSLLPELCYSEGEVLSDTQTSYVYGDENTKDYEISVLRHYADTFFDSRRQQLDFDENSSANVVENEISELETSLATFHQALLWESVPRAEYTRIKARMETLFSDGSADYERIRRELLSRVGCPYFKATSAFDAMLEKCGSEVKRVANLHTLSALSRDILDKYCAIIRAESEITAVLESMGGKYDYTLNGLEYRIKSPDSLYEKLYERGNDGNKSLETLFEESRDILRYTVVFNSEGDYCKSIKDMLTELMDRYSGQMECFRNYWTPYVSGEYKGINVMLNLPQMCWDTRENCLRDNSYFGSRYCITIPSFCFEVQFHTRTSLSVKERNHKLYERNRRADVSAEERQRNNEEMRRNVASITTPDGAEFLNMMSNEYIQALRESITLMQNELCEIGKKSYPYVSMEIINEL